MDVDTFMSIFLYFISSDTLFNNYNQYKTQPPYLHIPTLVSRDVINLTVSLYTFCTILFK